MDVKQKIELTPKETRKIESASKHHRYAASIAKLAGLPVEKVNEWRRMKRRKRDRERHREKTAVEGTRKRVRSANEKRRREARTLLKEFPDKRESILAVLGPDVLGVPSEPTEEKSVEQRAREYKRARRVQS